MAKKEFILQGFTNRTHASAVRELFDTPNVKHFILSVAFVNEGGVQAIEDKLRLYARKVTILAGIRNDITSHQGLTRLYSIIGSNLYTVDTGARNLLFHPKFYFACGNTQARLIVGSANLTWGGLNTNIEASMVLDFDLTNNDDKAVTDGIESLLSSLPAEYPAHIVRVSSTNEIDDLLLSGRIVDEMLLPAPRQTILAVGASTRDTIPRIKLKTPPLKHGKGKAQANAKTLKPEKASVATAKPPPAKTGIEFELVWESKPLERRDLSIPNMLGTHATGSINLDKGLLAEEIDHRHYFREKLFKDLEWTSATKTTEEAYAKFCLVIKQVNYGEFDLRIGHTISTTSTTYKQKNAMTRLSWGPVGKYVARPDLIGRKLSLYRDKADPTRFLLEID